MSGTTAINERSVERAQIFTTRRGVGAIALIRTLARRHFDEMLVDRLQRGGGLEMGSETKGVRFVYCKKRGCVIKYPPI